MKKLIDTLLRLKLEWRRFSQGGEMTYRDWKQALHYFITRGLLQKPYKCSYCTKFHLTSHDVYYEHLSMDFRKGFNEWFDSEIYDVTI